MPQQLVAKVKGHNEFDRDQFTRSWKVDAMIPPPGVGIILPGKTSVSVPGIAFGKPSAAEGLFPSSPGHAFLVSCSLIV
jgi:hypothetical protein